MKIKYFEWADKAGCVHKIPDKTCVICKHCTDIFLDPLKANYDIYAIGCAIPGTDSDPRKCDHFEYDAEHKDKQPLEMEV